MNWPTHPAYKNSGVQWLGEVPAHWGLSPMFTVGHERTLTNAGLSETNLLSLSYGRIVRKDIDTTDGLLPASFDTYQIVEPFDIVFRFTDLQNDKRSLRSALVPERGIITSAYMAFSPTRIDPKYFSYLMRSYDLTKVFYSRGGGLRQSLKYEDVKRLPILVPPTDEQRVISRFLDRETAKIDALIDKQGQLIATLREDRAATITHAVTKGLDASVERRDSHVAWIGSIPAHWEIFKGTWIGTPFGSPAVPEEDVGTTGERAFLKVSSLSTSGFSPKDPEWFVRSTYRATADFVAFPKRGAAIFTNKVNVVDFPAVIDPNLMGWKMLPGHNAHYYAFLIGTLRLEEIADVSSVPQLNTKHIAGLLLPRPPVHEQREIVSYLLEQCRKIDALIDKSVEMIETLSEYRSALITNAVTGKIDVREAV